MGKRPKPNLLKISDTIPGIINTPAESLTPLLSSALDTFIRPLMTLLISLQGALPHSLHLILPFNYASLLLLRLRSSPPRSCEQRAYGSCLDLCSHLSPPSPSLFHCAGRLLLLSLPFLRLRQKYDLQTSEDRHEAAFNVFHPLELLCVIFAMNLLLRRMSTTPRTGKPKRNNGSNPGARVAVCGVHGALPAGFGGANVTLCIHIDILC